MSEMMSFKVLVIKCVCDLISLQILYDSRFLYCSPDGDAVSDLDSMCYVRSCSFTERLQLIWLLFGITSLHRE